MKRVLLISLMIFLLFGMLSHTPLVFADENNNSNSSGNSNSSEDDDNSTANDSDDDEDEDDLNETGDDNDENETEKDKDRNKSNRSGVFTRTKEIMRGNYTIIIEKTVRFEDGKRVEVIKKKIVTVNGTEVEVDIKIENRTEDGRFRERIRYRIGEEEFKIEIDERLKLEEDANGTEYRLRARFMGNVTDIKIMPDIASEIALERLRTLNFTVELREISTKENVSRIVYQARAYKDGRFIGILKLKVKVEAQIDPETGEIIGTTKPWWAFFVFGEDSDQTQDGTGNETEDDSEMPVPGNESVNETEESDDNNLEEDIDGDENKTDKELLKSHFAGVDCVGLMGWMVKPNNDVVETRKSICASERAWFENDTSFCNLHDDPDHCFGWMVIKTGNLELCKSKTKRTNYSDSGIERILKEEEKVNSWLYDCYRATANWRNDPTICNKIPYKTEYLLQQCKDTASNWGTNFSKFTDSSPI